MQFDNEAAVIATQEDQDRKLAISLASRYHEISDSESESNHTVEPAVRNNKTLRISAESDDSDVTVDLGRNSPDLISESNESESDKPFTKLVEKFPSVHEISDTDEDKKKTSPISEHFPQEKVSNSSLYLSESSCSEEESQSIIKRKRKKTRIKHDLDTMPRQSKETCDKNEGANNTKEKTDYMKKPRCQYGSKCYRKNPSHFEEFWHPGLAFIHGLIRVYNMSDLCSCLSGDLLKKRSLPLDESPSAKRLKTAHDDPETQAACSNAKLPKHMAEGSTLLQFYLTKVSGIQDCFNRKSASLHIEGLTLNFKSYWAHSVCL